jgi:hypothetical protein
MPNTVGIPHSRAIRRTIRLLTASGIAIDSLEAGACLSFLGVVLLGAGSGWVLAVFLRF